MAEYTTHEKAACIEFDEAALPQLLTPNVRNDIYLAAVKLLGYLHECPYCKGRGDFAASLRIDGEPKPIQLRAVCGQCMGEGTRDEADAVALVKGVLADLADALLPLPPVLGPVNEPYDEWAEGLGLDAVDLSDLPDPVEPHADLIEAGFYDGDI